MLKVLIADDEHKIIQLIEHLVDWDGLSMEIAARADNGIDALELAKRFRPDILITDIRMPGLDGLELICAVKEEMPGTEVIIISGYRHFEYAQTALKYGVSDYLLKPIKRSELNRTLEKIAEKSGHRKTDESRKKKDSSSLRQVFIRDIVHGYRIENAQDYHIHFEEDEFCFIVVKLDGDALGIKSNMEFILEKAVHDLREELKVATVEMEPYIEDSHIFAIVNYDRSARDEVYRSLRRFLESMTSREHILKGLRTTIALGTGVSGISDFGKSLRNARLWIEERIVQGTNKVYMGEWNRGNSFFDSDLFTEYHRRMEKAMESLDICEVQTVLGELNGCLSKETSISGHNIMQMCKQICNQLLLFASKNRIFLWENTMDEFNRKLECCGELAGVLACMTDEVTKIYAEIARQKSMEDHRPIRMAKNYIREHFNQSITLEEVSEVVGFAPTYLSNLFKKETGNTFIEYVQSKRMDVAKELLKTTNLSVAVVGEKVGYSDVRYFTKIFMKNTGLKPNEYRKLYA